MEDEIISLFYRIHNSFPSIENSKENERVFDCLSFRSEMNRQRSMISIFKNFQSGIHGAVERTSSRTKLSYSNHFLTNRRSMNDEKSRVAAIVLSLESYLYIFKFFSLLFCRFFKREETSEQGRRTFISEI